jgi:hypothetical protein
VWLEQIGLKLSCEEMRLFQFENRKPQARAGMRQHFGKRKKADSVTSWEQTEENIVTYAMNATDGFISPVFAYRRQ